MVGDEVCVSLSINFHAYIMQSTPSVHIGFMKKTKYYVSLVFCCTFNGTYYSIHTEFRFFRCYNNPELIIIDVLPELNCQFNRSPPIYQTSVYLEFFSLHFVPLVGSNFQ